MINAEYLEKELASMKQQLANATAVAQQASGAIQLIESLLAKLRGEDSMTLDEFGKAVGAKSVEIVENKGA